MGTGVTPERIVTKSGEYEIRTRDLLLARQVLSQLSYTPNCAVSAQRKWCLVIALAITELI